MEKIADVIKLFLEKHLMPTLFSFSGAIVVFLILPSNNWIVLKLGNALFILFWFGIFFIFVESIIYLSHKVRINNKAPFREHLKQQNEKAIIDLNNYIDSILPIEKKLLINFIENGNKILVTSWGGKYGKGVLENNSIFVSSVFEGDVIMLNTEEYWIEAAEIEAVEKGFRPVMGYTQYKVKDEVFNWLKNVYEEQGRLGNF